MKYLYIFLFLLPVQKVFGQYKFTLKVNTTANLNGKKVYLLVYDYYSLKSYTKSDSTIIRNNSFSFAGNAKRLCETATLYIPKEIQSCLGRLNFVIDTGLNTLTFIPNKNFDPANLYTRNDTALVKSKANFIHYKMDSLSNNFYRLYGKHIPGSVSGQYLEQEKAKELNIKQLELLSTYPDEYYSLMAIYEIAQNAEMARETQIAVSAFNKLSPAIRSNPLGQEFYKRETGRVAGYNASKANKPVPQFTIRTEKGNVFSNKEIIGNLYIVAFSATWCIPCQESQKKLLFLYHKYKKQDLKVIYFNLDDDVIKWKKLIAEKKLDWINVSDRVKIQNSKVAKLFDVASIPLYILVDKHGIITYNSDEAKDYDHVQLADYVKKAL